MKTMTRVSLVFIALLAFIGVILSAQAAQATLLNGSFAYNGFGSPSYTGGNLHTATSVTFVSLNMATSAGSGDLAPVLPLLSTDVHLNPLTLPVSNINGSPLSVSYLDFLSFGSGNRFQFDMTQVTFSSPDSGYLNIYGTGIVHDTLGTYSDTSAETRISFNANGSVTYGGTFATSAVPIPAALYLLGPGLVGIVGLKRRFLGC